MRVGGGPGHQVADELIRNCQQECDSDSNTGSSYSLGDKVTDQLAYKVK